MSALAWFRDGIPMHSRALYPARSICTCTCSYVRTCTCLPALRSALRHSLTHSQTPYAFLTLSPSPPANATHQTSAALPPACPPSQLIRHLGLVREAAEGWWLGRGVAVSRMTVCAACDGRAILGVACDSRCLLRVMYGAASTQQRFPSQNATFPLDLHPFRSTATRAPLYLLLHRRSRHFQPTKHQPRHRQHARQPDLIRHFSPRPPV